MESRSEAQRILRENAASVEPKQGVSAGSRKRGKKKVKRRACVRDAASPTRGEQHYRLNLADIPFVAGTVSVSLFLTSLSLSLSPLPFLSPYVSHLLHRSLFVYLQRLRLSLFFCLLCNLSFTSHCPSRLLKKEKKKLL